MTVSLYAVHFGYAQGACSTVIERSRNDHHVARLTSCMPRRAGAAKSQTTKEKKGKTIKKEKKKQHRLFTSLL